MKTFIAIGQVVTGLCLIGLVLLQARGEGLASAGARSGEFFRQLRGPEKAMFLMTVGIAIAFLIFSLLMLI